MKRPARMIRDFMRYVASTIGEWADDNGYNWRHRRVTRSIRSDSFYISLRRPGKAAVVVRVSDHEPTDKCQADINVLFPITYENIESVKSLLYTYLRDENVSE